MPSNVDKAPYVVIDKEIGSEGEPDPLGDELNVHYIDRERTVVFDLWTIKKKWKLH